MTSPFDYGKTYTSYSGTDIVASIRLSDDMPPVVIGELQTVSYSTHREVFPVRTLGRINALGFTNGPRTIAGSLIFTVFDKNIVYNLLEVLNENNKNSGLQGNIVMDEMPPFDIIITMMNEYGSQSVMAIKGVVIVDEGQVMSIEDMITENTMSYMAEDIQVLSKMSLPVTNIREASGATEQTESIKPPSSPSTYANSKKEIELNFVKGKGAHTTEIQVMKGAYDSLSRSTYTTTGTTIILSGLQADTKYFLRMRSIDKNGTLSSAWTTTEWWFFTPIDI